MNRQYCQTHTVRYDECNCHGLLTPVAFLRYMQDLAARDAEDVQLLGSGYWVIKRTVITFAAPVPIHTLLTLRTYGIGFTRITAQRGYEAQLVGKHSDEPVISARTLWVYVDARGRPMRLPEGTAQIWLPDGPRSQLPDAPLPACPESVPETTACSVRFSDIDLMRHLNNASAVEMLDNAGWEVCGAGGITPDTTRLDLLDYEIDYLDSPRFGERLEIQTWHDPFPLPGQQYTRFQQLMRGGSVMVRARSRWLCRAANE
jgi:acyl-CoA thioesterase FadM